VTCIASPAAPSARRTRLKAPRRAPARPSAPAPPHLELTRKVEGLPKDMGVVLIGLGVVGIAIPGPIPPGASFVLLGVLFLRPGLIAKLAGSLARRFPRVFRFLIGFVDDLRTDLGRRYPNSVGC
jgi:hypothetical protein